MEAPAGLEPATPEPATPAPRSRRARRRRLTLAGALLTAATLGTVFSVQAMAAGGTTPPPGAPPAHDKAIGELKAGKGHERGFMMAIRLKDGDVAKIKDANEDFTACMRDEGLHKFPGFEVSSDDDGSVLLELSLNGKGGLDPTSKKFQKAYRTCAPIFKDAGVDLPDSPVPPGKPGKPGEPGLHKEFKDDGSPDASTSASV
ncbi:hypothetical protein [Streptomyces sp. NBC_01304]|uniref:hypothetical protein n=1 Tax=Streptomyces sp. NBC_01304 TaxID=2903818 RepID=UPI002E0F346C|nr:hypothetical protein OG430_15705 [Streptomyces sp. NBC_01304]